MRRDSLNRYTFLASLAFAGCSPAMPAASTPSAGTLAPETAPSAAKPAGPSAQSSAQAAQPDPPPQRADVAAPRVIETPWMPLAEWRRRVQAQQDAPREGTQLAFLGDSITEGWTQTPHFNEVFGAQQPLKLGIGGDQTQHLLWRLEHGALDGVSPKLVVILIGVNNLGNGHTPQQAASGIAAVAHFVRAKLPKTRIILLAVLPAAAKANEPLRKLIADTNTQLPAIAADVGASVVDLGAPFVDPDGTIPATKMADFLHPTALGYDLLTDQLAHIVL